VDHARRDLLATVVDDTEPPSATCGVRGTALEGNKAAMRKLIDMFVTGDLSDVHSVVAAEYVDHQGNLSGPEGFSRIVSGARIAAPGLRISVEDLIAQGDKVVARLPNSLRWPGHGAE
jgi:predicted ester cyclase